MGSSSITLAGNALEVVVPDDLDAKLAAAGTSVAEMRRHLAGNCIASTVAAALLPLLTAPTMKRGELASAIAREGVGEIRAAVLELYGGDPAPKKKGKKAGGKPKPSAPEPVPLTVERYCDLIASGEFAESEAATLAAFRKANGEAVEAELERRNQAALAAEQERADGEA